MDLPCKVGRGQTLVPAAFSLPVAKCLSDTLLPSQLPQAALRVSDQSKETLYLKMASTYRGSWPQIHIIMDGGQLRDNKTAGLWEQKTSWFSDDIAS